MHFVQIINVIKVVHHRMIHEIGTNNAFGMVEKFLMESHAQIMVIVHQKNAPNPDAIQIKQMLQNDVVVTVCGEKVDFLRFFPNLFCFFDRNKCWTWWCMS